METKRQTLREIDAGLREAIERAEEADTEEEQEQAHAVVFHYVEQELAKVDRIREYLLYCDTMETAAKGEVEVQKLRAKHWSDRARNLKTICQIAMEQRGVSRLEGNTGTLQIKANGGRAAVEVNNPDLVPVHLIKYTAIMFGDRAYEALRALRTAFPDVFVGWQARPMLAEIGEILARGEAVAGCSLADRGKYVEVK